MKHTYKLAALVASLALSATVPLQVSAEAVTTTGGGSLSADARVDFRIDIPRMLRFRVGQPAAGIDLIDFQPTLAELGNGNDVAATAGSGDLGNGDVSVEVVSNAGQVTIAHDSNGGSLSDGTGNSIPYTEILTASSDVTNLAAPVLGTADNSTPPATNGLTNHTATWTYTYDNSAVYPSGVYGGVNTNGGRVTYTASTP